VSGRSPLALVVFDVDGVMTDGRFAYNSTEGKAFKTFGPDDGDALKLLKAQVPVAFVSADGRGFPISERRIAQDMGHEIALVSQGERLAWIADRAPLDQVAYMGDSFTDITVLDAVGTGITTSDALPGVQRAATYVTGRRGGDRAVAEACFFLLVERLGRTEWEGIL
jgi:3-deoxy-D-manno-octulosonate 8-phosphate phosphatase (KDO 8-P phosphatase)